MPRRRLGATEETKLPANADKGGRPTDLTPELIEKIVGPLRIGARVQTASAFNGISYDTMRSWILKGHEHPDSIYGALIKKIEKTIAEWEMRDISVIEKHAMGAPAEYEKEVVRDHDGKIVMDGDKPLMQVARDADGNPIIKSHAIKSDWKAAIERLRARLPGYWNKDRINLDTILEFDARKSERDVNPVEKMSLAEQVKQAVKELEEEF